MQILKISLLVSLIALMMLCVFTYRDPSPARALHPNAVEGLGAKLGAEWDLAQQDVRMQELTEEVDRVIESSRGLLRWEREYRVHRVLRSRIAELDIEIARVNASSSYSVTDKEKILTALEWERVLWSVHLPFPPW